MLPITANFFPASTIQAKNSRKRENGGLVIIKSASLRSSVTSLLRKSPSPSIYFHSRSSILIRPSPLLSRSKMNILPLPVPWTGRIEALLAQTKRADKVFCIFAIRSITRRNQFFKPNSSNLAAKYRVKLLHSGSSQGSNTVFPLNTSGSYSR